MPIHHIETHSHTATVSPCGNLAPDELANACVRAGYSALVVTDHLVGWLPIFSGVDSWKDRVHRFFSGFRAVREAGEAAGLTVLPGFEISFADLPRKDFLVYGLDEPILSTLPDVCAMQFPDFKDLASEMGGLVFQAHPFRYTTPVAPHLLDGVEVYNGNPRHESNNHRAVEFAAEHDLMTISGSDAHQHEDIGRGGVTASEVPSTIHELVTMFRDSPRRVALREPTLAVEDR